MPFSLRPIVDHSSGVAVEALAKTHPWPCDSLSINAVMAPGHIAQERQILKEFWAWKGDYCHAF